MDKVQEDTAVGGIIITISIRMDIVIREAIQVEENKYQDFTVIPASNHLQVDKKFTLIKNEITDGEETDSITVNKVLITTLIRRLTSTETDGNPLVAQVDIKSIRSAME